MEKAMKEPLWKKQVSSSALILSFLGLILSTIAPLTSWVYGQSVETHDHKAKIEMLEKKMESFAGVREDIATIKNDVAWIKSMLQKEGK